MKRKFVIWRNGEKRVRPLLKLKTPLFAVARNTIKTRHENAKQGIVDKTTRGISEFNSICFQIFSFLILIVYFIICILHFFNN